MKHTFKRKGMYIIMGVDGEDFMYFQFENKEALNKAVEAMIQYSVKAIIRGKIV